MATDLDLVKRGWAGFSDEEKLKVVETMRDRHQSDPVWQGWLADRPIEELQRLSTLATPITEKPLDADGRFAVKNFSNDPDAAIAHIKKLNPDLENVRWRGGRIVGQHAGENFDRVLDPDTFSIGEVFRDAGDLAYDAADVGVTTGMGALGFLTGGPVGGIASASAGGAGMESFKQMIGEYLDVGKRDPGAIGMAALTSGVPGVGGAAARGGMNVARSVGNLGAKAAPPVGKFAGSMVGFPKTGEKIARALTAQDKGSLGEKMAKHRAKVLQSKDPALQSKWYKTKQAVMSPYTQRGVAPSIYHSLINSQDELGGGAGNTPLMY